jgi:dTDP-4-dehydrorhamnose reductase
MTTRPRILILGSNGQVGVELQRSFAEVGEIAAPGRDSVDLAHPEQLRAIVRSATPDIILNAAAYTAVDRAESEPDLARSINAVAPGVLAEEALRLSALLIHYSTDYVFDGSKTGSWLETDATNPLNVYGATKLAGEQAIQQVGGRFLIFRTSWVYGPHGKNFLFTMLRLGRARERLSIVDDQIGAPTTSSELAEATRDIVMSVLREDADSMARWSGVYHMTCGGSVSWCGFARAIFERAGVMLDGKKPEVAPISSHEYPTPAKRPRNSIMSNEKLNARFGISLAPWESALDHTMKRLRLNSGR